MARNRLTALLKRAQARAVDGPTGLGVVPVGWLPSPWQQCLYQRAYEQACEEVAREVRRQRFYSACSN